MAKKSDRSKQLIDEFVNYLQTVRALLAFAAFVVHDRQSRRPNSQFGFGRRMTTSIVNMIAPEQDITPDLVAQKDSNYGIVAEAKRSLPKNKDTWNSVLEQLRKYDDSLTGWWTDSGQVRKADSVLLLHQSRSRPFVKFTQDVVKADDQRFGPSSSIIEFNESQETGLFYHFRVEYGSIGDPGLSKKLEDGVSVPIESVIRTCSNIQYYDADPPFLLVLVNLWTDYFPSVRLKDCYDAETRVWKIEVSLEKTVKELQRAHGSMALHQDERSREFPTKRMITKAFVWLEQHKLAERIANKEGSFLILHRGYRGDVREHFAKLLCKTKNGNQEAAAQMLLFGESAE